MENHTFWIGDLLPATRKQVEFIDVDERLTPIEILARARELLNAGWCRAAWAKYENDKRVMCSVGAMRMVAFGNEIGFTKERAPHHNLDAFQTALTILADELTPGRSEEYDNDTPFWRVVGWNDGLEQNKDEVIHGFDLAIKVAHEREQ